MISNASPATRSPSFEKARALALESGDLAEEERRTYAPKVFPPLVPEQTRVAGRLVKKPPEREALLTCHGAPFFHRNTLGLIAAAGGSGKSFLALQLAHAMAKGESLGPVRAQKPLQVLFLAAEDPQEELDRRLWRIGAGSFPENFHAASVAGSIGPLMELRNGNPAPSPHFQWLQETVKNHGPDILFLDPKARLFGLDENNNDHATQWINLLEGLVQEYQTSVLITHHTSKQNADNLSQAMSRGASALIDGVRWAAGITGLSEKEAQRFGLDASRNFIKLDLVKTNYTSKLPAPLYFQRTAEGVLTYVNLGASLVQRMAEALCQAVADENECLTLRELEREKAGKPLADAVKEKFPRFTRGKDMKKAAQYAVRQGWAEFEKQGTGRNPREVFKVQSLP